MTMFFFASVFVIQWLQCLSTGLYLPKLVQFSLIVFFRCLYFQPSCVLHPLLVCVVSVYDPSMMSAPWLLYLYQLMRLLAARLPVFQTPRLPKASGMGYEGFVLLDPSRLVTKSPISSIWTERWYRAMILESDLQICCERSLRIQTCRRKHLRNLPRRWRSPGQRIRSRGEHPPL